MNKKLIDLYNEWMETGLMPYSGLCYSLPKNVIASDEWRLFSEDKEDDVYWADGRDDVDYDYEPYLDFTALRQTIVLFICAMRNEL